MATRIAGCGRPNVTAIPSAYQSPRSPIVACVAVARGASTGRFTGSLYPNSRSRRPSSSVALNCSFREAPQLKSVGAIVCVAGVEGLRVIACATEVAVARGASTGRFTGSLYPNFKFRAARFGGGKGPARKPGDPAGRKGTAPFTAQSFGFGLRAPGVGRRPSAQARRFYEPQKHVQQLGPARLENQLRFSSPKNSHSPKHSPVLRPVSASLRLRFRSAGAARHAKAGSVYS